MKWSLFCNKILKFFLWKSSHNTPYKVQTNFAPKGEGIVNKKIVLGKILKNIAINTTHEKFICNTKNLKFL